MLPLLALLVQAFAGFAGSSAGIRDSTESNLTESKNDMPAIDAAALLSEFHLYQNLVNTLFLFNAEDQVKMKAQAFALTTGKSFNYTNCGADYLQEGDAQCTSRIGSEGFEAFTAAKIDRVRNYISWDNSVWSDDFWTGLYDGLTAGPNEVESGVDNTTKVALMSNTNGFWTAMFKGGKIDSIFTTRIQTATTIQIFTNA
eukprot:gb/GEZN01020157.1/.p1 GENE.gb/GEZN01020157.1/~~gb/GEZN01020157.1/.p1  ORF type:complete len:200 (-),score=31.90 gb/GEZN01020157.1/:19-618(-)